MYDTLSDEEKECENQKWLSEPPSDEFFENILFGMAGGRAPRLKPFRGAKGPHSVFNKNHYITYKPTRGNHWEKVKQFDRVGPAHYNPVADKYIPTPHVHDPLTPGGIRVPKPSEIPRF